MIHDIIRIAGGIFVLFASVIVGLHLIERLIKWRNRNGQ